MKDPSRGLLISFLLYFVAYSGYVSRHSSFWALLLRSDVIAFTRAHVGTSISDVVLHGSVLDGVG